jgi:hypothetical protein
MKSMQLSLLVVLPLLAAHTPIQSMSWVKAFWQMMPSKTEFAMQLNETKGAMFDKAAAYYNAIDMRPVAKSMVDSYCAYKPVVENAMNTAIQTVKDNKVLAFGIGAGTLAGVYLAQQALAKSAVQPEKKEPFIDKEHAKISELTAQLEDAIKYNNALNDALKLLIK